MHERVASNSPFEPVVGFSRAVRAGSHVYVSGTAAWDAAGKIAAGDVYAQTRQCIENIAAALAKAGASLSDVVRTRIYVVDVDLRQEAARAHREAFAAIMPAATLVEVSRLATPAMLVEVEADAVIEAE